MKNEKLIKKDKWKIIKMINKNDKWKNWKNEKKDKWIKL